MIIRKAKLEEAYLLSELSFRSKAYWGYSDRFMRACKVELTVSPENLCDERLCYMVAVSNDRIKGYYALETLSETEMELCALFIDPEFIGFGIGKVLLSHAKRVAADKGVTNLSLQSDPNAQGFYLAMGAVPSGKRKSSSIPGRFLPTFNIPLANS